MAKRVFRYFFDYLLGQEKWLNEMAEKGYRLIKCHILSYEFQKCKPSEYEYIIEFVGGKSLYESKIYQEYLKNLGYKVLEKSIDINYSIGKVKWRPWANGLGQIATSPGTYNKELLIIEKKSDGTPFKIHNSPKEKISMYRVAVKMNLWAILSMLFILIISILINDKFNPGILIVQILVIVFMVLWIVPTVKLIQTIHNLKKSNDI